MRFHPSRIVLLAAVALAAMCNGAQAAFPDTPIKLVTPFPPGGQVPTMAYMLAMRMGTALGQPVVLEPRPGAGGTIAASAVAKAPKDGYTLLFATSGMLGIAKYQQKDLAYDPVADFAPIAHLGVVAVGVFASNQAGIATPEQLLAAARANPGKINFSSPGIGSVSHLAGELLKARARVDMVHVPYQGFTAQVTDLIGGRTELAFAGMASGLPQVREGRFKLVAIAGKSRSKMTPEVPALGELLPGYDAPAWLGIVAPAGTPPDVLSRLEAAAQESLKDPALLKGLEEQGLDLEVIAGRGFGDKIRRELPLWEEAVKASSTPAR